MSTIKNSDIEIKIYTDNDLIILQFISEDRDIIVGFNLQEAQLLSLMIAEEVTAALLKKMQLFPDSPENIH